MDEVRELNGRGSMAARAPQPGIAGEPTLSHAQARRTGYDAEIRRLGLEEKLGKIVPLDRVRRATMEFAGTLARVIDQRPSRIEEIIAAQAKGGLQAARGVEKAERRELREEMAKAIDAIATRPQTGPRSRRSTMLERWRDSFQARCSSADGARHCRRPEAARSDGAFGLGQDESRCS
jgi:hypothetical protein